MQHYGPYNIDTDMSDTKVLYQRDGRIVRITLNRPEALNAIDSEIPALPEDAVERANHDPLARVMVLSGNGKAF